MEFKQRNDQIYIFNLPLLVAVGDGLEGVGVAIGGVGSPVKKLCTKDDGTLSGSSGG